MAHTDGHCATDAETIYVENKTSGCPTSVLPNAGVESLPYCNLQLAIDAATMPGGKRLIVLRGRSGFDGITAAIPNGQLSIVSQSSGPIHPGGTGTGVTLTSGELYLRDVRVRTGGLCIQVEAAGTLRMNRSIVEKCGEGGIHIKGGAFDITNSVIANNGFGTAGLVLFGGIFVESLPAGRVTRIANSTIYKNVQQGLTCAGPITATGLIAYGNVGGIDVNPTCITTPTSTTPPPCCTGDPMLDASYHLMSNSPCIDKLPPAMSTPDDIDGDPRPLGAFSDCGADEYKP